LREEVTDDDVAGIVFEVDGHPGLEDAPGEMHKLLHIEDALRKRVVGQEAPSKPWANAVRRSRAGLSDDRRPIGSFLFLGATGVG